MSQRSEKYARNMERRVKRLEEAVEHIAMDMTSQGVRLAMATHSVEEIRVNTERDTRTARETRRAERERKRAIRRRVFAVIGVMLAVALLAIIMARAVEIEPQVAEPTQAAVNPADKLTAAIVTGAAEITEPWTGEGEDPLEAEKIEAALLAQGYLSDAVPLPYDLQDIMRTACAEYGCPYPLALAVAETESHFNQDAVGAVGEVGIMQLNPGPGGSYHAELEAATGRDPTDAAGNIICGVYLLGKYMGTYEDPAMAAMAYNMGAQGAREARAAGVTSTDYTTAVLEAMERWECTVTPWGGI